MQPVLGMQQLHNLDFGTCTFIFSPSFSYDCL